MQANKRVKQNRALTFLREVIDLFAERYLMNVQQSQGWGQGNVKSLPRHQRSGAYARSVSRETVHSF